MNPTIDLTQILAALSGAQQGGVDPSQLSRLAEPFGPEDIEWRLQQAGKSGGGKLWAKCLAYVTNRAIMARLDEIVGPENWQNSFEKGPDGGVVCGIGIRVAGAGWVWKRDGAENTQVEATKGGLSGSMKRAGYQWAIGRYLYNLDEGFAEVSQERPRGDGWIYAKLPKDKGGDQYWWRPPHLPAWALPSGETKTRAERVTQAQQQAAPPVNAPEDPDFQSPAHEAAYQKITRAVKRLGSEHTCEINGRTFPALEYVEEFLSGARARQSTAEELLDVLRTVRAAA